MATAADTTQPPRVAVVTGGTRGIGLACATALARSGITVCAGGRSGDRESTRTDVITRLGGNGSCYELDVTDDTSITSFLDRTHSEHGPVSILVNAAGVYRLAALDDHDDALWSSTLDINLTGAFRMIRATLSDMRQARWGRIVNIASTSARTGAAGHAAYCASKAGLVGLTRCVAVEGAPDGINCVAVSPTWVETDMLHQSAKETAHTSRRSIAEVVEEITMSNPQQRLVQPEEVAGLVAYLCGDGARAVTGEDIQINAGAAV